MLCNYKIAFIILYYEIYQIYCLFFCLQRIKYFLIYLIVSCSSELICGWLRILFSQSPTKNNDLMSMYCYSKWCTNLGGVKTTVSLLSRIFLLLNFYLKKQNTVLFSFFIVHCAQSMLRLTWVEMHVHI